VMIRYFMFQVAVSAGFALVAVPAAFAGGNVAVTIEDGDLKVEGDDADNDIRIECLGDGKYRLSSAAGTRFNGEAGVDVKGVTDDLEVETAGGADTVVITVPGDVGDVTIAGDDIEIGTGKGGPDTISIHSAAGTRARIVDDLKIDASEGKAIVRIGSAVDGGSADAVLRVGDDLAIKASNDDDEITVGRAVTINDDLEVRARDGDDRISVQGAAGGTATRVGDETKIRAGDGNDTVVLATALFDNNVTVETGDDDDRVEVAGATFRDRAEVALGDDDDVLSVSGCTFEDDARFDGGDGTDELQAMAASRKNTYLDDVDVEGFDTID